MLKTKPTYENCDVNLEKINLIKCCYAKCLIRVTRKLESFQLVNKVDKEETTVYAIYCCLR